MSNTAAMPLLARFSRRPRAAYKPVHFIAVWVLIRMLSQQLTQQECSAR